MNSATKQTEYISIDGKRLETVWHGPSPRDAPTLVFLHEGLGCVTMWGDFPAKMAAATGCGAFVYSRLGYGNSDSCVLPRPIEFMHHEGLEVLPRALDAAGICECILIGHSDGGSIAIIYAGGTKAIPLRGLITEAAHVFCENITVHAIRDAREKYTKGGLRRNLEKYHGLNTDGAFWGWNDVWLHPDFGDWNIEEYVPGISVPMLVIQGDNDTYGTAAQVRSISRHATTSTEVVTLSDCGHSPHREHQTLVLQAMVDFISRTLS